ncbi:hypothetical protein Micbo1qcDRAFT_200915 [Microdochium bolleyi]|uniref:Uncharacterized protein n=1 Tax=Microdochium bolleyi TaxID=196109 RepID=A0A136JEG2_9PEZI|nr:hypothetical protein Micbo1qcDRAFT_200915 [Microdochium bolleyi]
MADSKLYHTIMTPINFLTFVISLWLVSNRYEQKRADMHPAPSRSRNILPEWLHRAIYRPQPYQYIDDQKRNPPNEKDERFYYHTKQKKIMKLEAADAFELRSSVLGALCVACVALVWVCVCLGRTLFVLAPWQHFWKV